MWKIGVRSLGLSFVPSALSMEEILSVGKVGFFKTKSWASGKNRESVFSGIEFSLVQLNNGSVSRKAAKKNMIELLSSTFLPQFRGVTS